MSRKIKSDGSVKALYGVSTGLRLKRPLIASRVQAGFPSPATDYLEGVLDLNEYLIKHPAATFFARVEGESMTGIGIFPDDIVIVDRSLEAGNNTVILARYDGEFAIKRLRIENGEYFLVPENEDYPVLKINEELDFVVWGVVTAVIHKV
ncbi:MAG: translesion error-prone DNA polymerase V autoproteolytic subunit [Candidatus Cloacimonetes bacterium]|nr:translesion error-prone DNA polymerase V autoproteolytic subunit [Candidatus Cloacimonadota bacterium]MDD4223175.1 translesion error-prone DNA polymerase V autoproteolytic subunit [Candidatus Cloacimonadota bacterium]